MMTEVQREALREEFGRQSVLGKPKPDRTDLNPSTMQAYALWLEQQLHEARNPPLATPVRTR